MYNKLAAKYSYIILIKTNSKATITFKELSKVRTNKL